MTGRMTFNAVVTTDSRRRVAIANINVWNRLNAATRQVAGAWQP